MLNPESPNPVQETTKWETEFELESNRFTIKFNDPVEAKTQVVAPVQGLTPA